MFVTLNWIVKAFDVLKDFWGDSFIGTGERDSQGGYGLCQSKKVNCALACIARGQAIRAVCMALGVSRSNVLTKKTRSSDWARQLPCQVDNLKLEISLTNFLGMNSIGATSPRDSCGLNSL